MATGQPIPRTLETPPRTTGNAQQDFPIIVDWMYRAYQVIQQSVAFINAQVTDNPDLDINDLPNPETTTLAQAQSTANEAYALASQADNKADEITESSLKVLLSDTFVLNDSFNEATVTFTEAQADTDYQVIVQAKETTGTPPVGAYIVQSKEYNTDDFIVTMNSSPGSGNSITFEWQLIRRE